MKLQLRNKRAAKLTAQDVRDIRARYAEGSVTQGQLARDYGISAIQIGRIVRWESWADVPQEMGREDLTALGQRLLQEQELQDRLTREVEEAKRENTPGQTKADEALRDLLESASDEAKQQFNKYR